MIYGYARVSTCGQAKDGNSLEAQENMLRENGATVIYKDSFTGTKLHRPELDKLMNVLQDGDMLIVAKLDRIARSTMHGSKLIEDLLNKNVRVNILNIGVMDNTPASKLIRNIFFAFAEFERDMIVERTTEGKVIARQKPDYKEGRKKIEVPNFAEHLDAVAEGIKTASQAAKELGITRAKWYRLVKNA